MEEPEPAPRGELFGGRAAARRFRRVAEGVVDALLESAPEQATVLGDHRFDDRLSDLSEAGIATRADLLSDALQALDGVDDEGLTADDHVDREILRTVVAADLWRLEELREHEHDPLLHLPGDALYPLLASHLMDAGEPAARAMSVAARLAAVPRHLEVAREQLGSMPRVHVETAIGQARGIAELLGADLERLLDLAPATRTSVDAVRGPAAQALEDFARWLESRLPESDADPRLGDQRFAAKLWYALDTETSPDVLLTRAESDLQAVEEEIAELASRIAGAPPRSGQVREVLDRLALEAPVTDATILPLCRTALQQVSDRVRELDLVGVPDDPIEIVVMPAARRGVAVAYCDPPGPLEPSGPDGVPLPSLFAVAPTPPGWSGERVASFYREYNGHMIRNLAVHEGVPGHVLQLAHASRYRGGTRVRSAFWSGPFVEGWAVYAENLVAAAGLGGPPEDDDALRMQRLKMLLRSTINAVLDVRVHARGMTEAEAMRLLTERGHQEEGEAAGKWRRALLTSAQLSTYYVGYHEVRDVVGRLRAVRPEDSYRQLHDEVLAHGSPPPRHLRTILGLP